MKTKLLLQLSTALNSILIGVSGYLFFARSLVSTAIPPANTASPLVEVTSPSASRAVPSPVKFQWRQVEADDYPTYVANLRAIGMPESTLRTIVTAEITAQYVERQKEIATARVPSSQPHVQRQQRLDQLQREKESLIRSLLSVDRSATDGERPATVTATSAEATIVAPEAQGAVLIPAVLVPPDPTIAFTTEQRLREWEKLQGEFIDAVGGPDQSSEDPAYRARWVEAQQLSDAMFKAKYGTTAFVLQNILAGRQKREQ